MAGVGVETSGTAGAGGVAGGAFVPAALTGAVGPVAGGGAGSRGGCQLSGETMELGPELRATGGGASVIGTAAAMWAVAGPVGIEKFRNSLFAEAAVFSASSWIGALAGSKVCADVRTGCA